MEMAWQAEEGSAGARRCKGLTGQSLNKPRLFHANAWHCSQKIGDVRHGSDQHGKGLTGRSLNYPDILGSARTGKAINGEVRRALALTDWAVNKLPRLFHAYAGHCVEMHGYAKHGTEWLGKIITT